MSDNLELPINQRRPTPAPKSSAARVKVDAKGFFSTERTFLHWARVAMMLVFTGCIMTLNSLDSVQLWFAQLQGLVLAFVGLLFGYYAFNKYDQRMIGYNTGKTMCIQDFLDVRAPIVLGILQTFGLGFSVYVAVLRARAEREYYHGSDHSGAATNSQVTDSEMQSFFNITESISRSVPI